jgi:hypothetical protein
MIMEELYGIEPRAAQKIILKVRNFQLFSKFSLTFLLYALPCRNDFPFQTNLITIQG